MPTNNALTLDCIMRIMRAEIPHAYFNSPAAGERFARAIESEVLAPAQQPSVEVTPLKVERHSDMSVLVVFSSCRQASVFEREIAARTKEGEFSGQQPSGEVTDYVRVPARVVELLAIINRDGVIKRASELQEVYRLINAARAGEKQ
ncbi:hypothetical protein BH02_3795 [Burkholderia pseudomallei]|uniref:hypothetical protein n=1 Tax=Burkholderia pseudomallei TaxID=28450 RepID=UPI0000F29092|nr:hypothetical protein [Burkholderia pseudomallei]ABN86024.1 conserved hypothetical protein [Burkholderia pseudomallei 668]AJX90181.1 hypothetical protein BH02_3795 [Burkholderia pseudomallei]